MNGLCSLIFFLGQKVCLSHPASHMCMTGFTLRGQQGKKHNNCWVSLDYAQWFYGGIPDGSRCAVCLYDQFQIIVGISNKSDIMMTLKQFLTQRLLQDHIIKHTEFLIFSLLCVDILRKAAKVHCPSILQIQSVSALTFCDFPDMLKVVKHYQGGCCCTIAI